MGKKNYLIKKKKFFPFISRCFKKKMSKIKEFEVCDRFMTKIVPFILPIEQTKFVLVYYKVPDEEFVITVNYDRSQFEHKINEFVHDIMKEAQNSDSYRYNWKVQWPLCEKIEDPPLSYFDNSVVIIFSRI